MPKVFCLAIDHDKTVFLDPFEVTYDSGMSVENVKHKVMRMEPIFHGVPSSRVAVYHSPDAKLSKCTTVVLMQTAISALNLPDARVVPTRLMQDEDDLLIFQRIPPPVDQSPVFHSQSTSFKRPRSPADDMSQHAQFNNAKILRTAPSDVGQLSTYWSIQKNGKERFLDDRPYPDLHVPPIPLLYEPFGEFDDIFAERMPVPADIDIDRVTLQLTVNELAAGMTLSFEKEFQRRVIALDHLSQIFVCDSKASAIGAYQTDGHSEIHCQMVDTIIEIKNELPGINAVPYAQSTAHVGQSHKRSGKIQELCNRCRLPALCITIVGTEIQFFAILLLGHQYRVVSLTPGLSCCLSATNGLDRKHLYSAFAAAIVLRQRIRRDLDSYHQSYPPVLAALEFYFPAVSTILEHGSAAENPTYLKFKVLDHYGERVPFRHLYRAGVAHGDADILVKFTRQYCITLHDHCAALGNAPKVLGFQQLPGGWFAIAMEILPNAQSIKSILRRGQKDELLVNLVKGFHEKELVHGDLRSVNIICNDSGEKFWLIDFDWGGKAGEVQYPTWLLNQQLRNVRQSKDLTIWKEDDMRIFEATLADLADPK